MKDAGGGGGGGGGEGGVGASNLWSFVFQGSVLS